MEFWTNSLFHAIIYIIHLVIWFKTNIILVWTLGFNYHRKFHTLYSIVVLVLFWLFILFWSFILKMYNWESSHFIFHLLIISWYSMICYLLSSSSYSFSILIKYTSKGNSTTDMKNKVEPLNIPENTFFQSKILPVGYELLQTVEIMLAKLISYFILISNGFRFDICVNIS